MNETARNKYDELLKNGHAELLNGTRFSAFRSLSRRRFTVATAAAGLGLYLVGVPFHVAWLTLVGLVLFLGCAVLIRFTTRGVADLPASALDERQLMVRNAVYVAAYRLTGGLVALMTILCLTYSVWGKGAVPVEVCLQVLFSTLFAAIAMPSCVLAWTEREA